MKELFNCRLRVLSPVHVGCDEVYEPTAFVVDEQAEELVSFDPLSFIESLSAADKARFSAICAKGDLASLIEIYKFMRGRRLDGTRVGVCPGFVEHYQKTLTLSSRDPRKLQNELNNFVVLRTAFESATQRPYLPGSAVKGALRTAYLNLLAGARTDRIRPNGNNANQKARSLEQILLDGGSFQTDPLRMLKVSDFTAVGPVQTRVVYAVNRSKKPTQQDQPRPYQILEVIEPGAEFVGTIRVDGAPTGAGIKRPLTLHAARASATHFFGAELKREQRELAGIGVGNGLRPLPEGAVILRIGRHSGAESVTIAGYRDIFIMKGKSRRDGRQDDHATTLWLAATNSKPQTNSALKPFGWVGLEEVSASELAALEQTEWERRKAEAVNQAAVALASGAAGTPNGAVVPAPEAVALIPAPEPPPRIVWERAALTWTAGSGELTATWEGRKALVKGKDLIPANLQDRLVAKKKKAKAVIARVTVEAIGNGFAIVAIEEI